MTEYINGVKSGAGSQGSGNFFFLPQVPDTVGAGTFGITISANSNYQGLFRCTSANDGDNCTFNIGYFSAGTYTLEISYVTSNDKAKLDVFIDSDKVISAKDMYNGAVVYGANHKETGITLTEGVKTLKLALNGKNAASSGYAMDFNYIKLVRTA